MKANWGGRPRKTEDGDPFEGRTQESATPVETSGSNDPLFGGKRAAEERPWFVPEEELWERRDETTHPMPVGYWREYAYTLDTPIEELEARLNELVKREANLAGTVTCELKDRGDMACSACPVSECGQDTAKSLLCRLGREQERIASLLITKRMFDGR